MTKLHKAGREYFFWDVDGLPTSPPATEASVDDGETWMEAAYVDTPVVDATTVASLLVAGPDYPTPGGGAVAHAGRNLLLTRLVDAPETVIRLPGAIDVWG